MAESNSKRCARASLSHESSMKGFCLTPERSRSPQFEMTVERLRTAKTESKMQFSTQVPPSCSFSSQKPTPSIPRKGSASIAPGDRFIPSQGSAVVRQLFTLPETAFALPTDVSMKSETEQNSIIFESILERQLLHLELEDPLDKADDKSDRAWSCLSAGKPSSVSAIRGSLNNSEKKVPRQPQVPTVDGYSGMKRPKLLNFSEKKVGHRRSESFEEHDQLETAAAQDNPVVKNIRHIRRISKTPMKVLDAPGLLDDFYQNVLDWSANDVIAISLSNRVYFWSCRNNQNTILKAAEAESEDFYCSVKWNPAGDMVALGSDLGHLEVSEHHNGTLLWSQNCHEERISSISWMNDFVFSTGSRDNTINTFDLRCGSKRPLATMSHHSQEVCGLKWSPHGGLLASGGNDNLILVWDPRKTDSPILTLSDHQAAVRALAWSPHQFGCLLSGGGNGDKSLKTWNVNTGVLLSSVVTDSQICNLAFSPHSNEFVSTHGYVGNQIMVWNSLNYERLCVFEGHSSRVLHLAVSPDGENIATASADERLKFWKVFPKESTTSNFESSSLEMNLGNDTHGLLQLR